MKKALLLSACLLTFTLSLVAQDNHEYAPVEEKTIAYKDWTLKSLADEKPVNLRQWMDGKKLVLVVYFAPWCPNWHNEAPIVEKLNQKYGSQGLGVIAVSEYAPVADVRKFFGEKNAPYTVVVDSVSRDDREKTAHYTYRTNTGDHRRWGSPYNIFIDPTKINPDGETLTEKAWVANGELVEAEADKFVRERLNVRQD